MKEFIVFIAFLIVFSAAMVYRTDSNNYVRLQKQLKSLSEECASGAILMQDIEETNRQGRYVIDLAMAKTYVDRIIAKKIGGKMAPISLGTISAEISTQELRASDTAVKIILNWHCEDGIFRLRNIMEKLIDDENVSISTVYETKMKTER